MSTWKFLRLLKLIYAASRLDECEEAVQEGALREIASSPSPHQGDAA